MEELKITRPLNGSESVNKRERKLNRLSSSPLVTGLSLSVTGQGSSLSIRFIARSEFEHKGLITIVPPAIPALLAPVQSSVPVRRKTMSGGLLEREITPRAPLLRSATVILRGQGSKVPKRFPSSRLIRSQRWDMGRP